MASSTGGGNEEVEREIHLRKGAEWWVAEDVDRGVASQGKTRSEALDNLDEALALADGETGRPPTDEELREAGIDPAENETGDQEPPDVLD